MNEAHIVPSRLWAVTSYFNPCGYRRRRSNYRIFRDRLQIPLLTVELSFDGKFELRPEDADGLIRLPGRDVMWQKERLLNLGVEALPPECDRVAMIDCDVVFEDDDWPSAADAALDRHPVIQPFEFSKELSRDEVAGAVERTPQSPICRSAAYGIATGQVDRTIMKADNKRDFGFAFGFAWAAHRDLLERLGVYDACVMGGGDVAIAAAGIGGIEDYADYLLFNQRRREHIRAWARPFYEIVRGNLGYCRGTVSHLWHGELKDRNYRDRRIRFSEFDFDPHRDIVIDDGPWRWNSDKPEMHRFVRSYFGSKIRGRPAGCGRCAFERLRAVIPARDIRTDE